MEELPELPGDALDVNALKAWALAHQSALEEVKQNLSVEVEGLRDLDVELLERWQEMQQAVPRPSLHGLTRLGDELLRARGARLEAHERLQDWKGKKQAAQAALAKAMALEEDEESEEETRSLGPSEPEVEAEGEKKRGWRGAKKFLGKGLKKIRGKSSTPAGSLTPPTAISPVSSASPRPATPKELMVKASSDELEYAVEGMQGAAEDLDRETMKCQELQEAISASVGEHRCGAWRATQEALRDGVCALEEWADEMRVGDWELITATSAGDPASENESEVSKQTEGEVWEQLEHLEAENQALLRRLPADFVLRHMDRPEGPAAEPDEDADATLARLAWLEELQRSAKEMGETPAVQRLRRGTGVLERRATCLETASRVLRVRAASPERPVSSPDPASTSSSEGSEAALRTSVAALREAAVVSDELNPFEPDEPALNPFAEPPNPFEGPSNPFAQPSNSSAEPSNPFADSFAEPSNSFEPLNPFAEPVNSPSNPFASSSEGSEGFQDAVSEKQAEGPGETSPLKEVAESPASFTEVCAYRPALPQKPAFVDALAKSEPASGCSTPRVTSMMPGAASSMQVVSAASPRQLQSSLAGCLVATSTSPRALELDEDSRQIVEAPSLEAALAKSDAALAEGRLGNGDYARWDWRDHAAEEGHQVLRYSSHSLSDLLTEEDWSYFSYELLVLCRHLLREGPALDQVLALIPICRVRLGINTQLHHHIVELCRPENEVHSPLDVRYRASLLLRLWSQWEIFDYSTVADPSSDWTSEWVCIQLRILRGCVLERAMQLHEEDDDVSRCQRSFEAIRALNEIALSGAWGKPQPLERLGEMSGRRWLTVLCGELEALSPGERWCFNVVFATRVFGSLWRAAADSEAEDCLSLDAPQVAAALLSGLHPHLAPLQLETHALLLAQQLCATAFASGHQLPAKALAVSESIVSDFSSWLQKTPVDAAACFARQGFSARRNPPLELVARRLLTVDLRDQLIQTLRDYRRHCEPAAFRPMLLLWVRCYRETRCSSLRARQQDEDGEQPKAFLRDEEAEELMGRFGQWFVWESSSKAAESALHPFDEPPQVPPGEEAWKRLGPKVKTYLTGLTGAVQSLLEELDCEKSFYNEAWASQGLGGQHLAVAASAMVAAVRPRVERLKLGVWPTDSVMEVPPAGGRLIQVLEALDREASRYRQAQVVFEPLVDILVPHVTAALTQSLATLDRDITSKALDGRPEEIFVPLQPPSSIFCEAVVTLWRFLHDALDAPLSLGIPVDIVAKPFMDFLSEVLPRSSEKLLRSCEQRDCFGMSIRAAQVAVQLKNTGCAIDSDEEDAGKPLEESKRSGRSRRKFFTRGERSFLEDQRVTAKLLEVEPKVVATSVQQVMVRLASIGFCCGELAEVQSKLFKMINSGDDDGCPTARHNQARMLICEELPELQDSLLYRGQTLARYLAARLVYHELRAELFEKLYFKSVPTGGGTPTPASGSLTPAQSFTPGAATTNSFIDAVPVLTLKDVVLSRQNSFLSLIDQTPTILLVSFVGELGIELTHAWLYVIVDYLRKQKLDQISEFLEGDQEALSRWIESMMQMTRKRVQATALGGLTHDDCRDVEKRLEEVQGLSQCLIEEMQSRTAEDLARYAAKLRGEELVVRERSHTPPPGPKLQQRSASPAITRGHEASLSPRGQSPQLPDSPMTEHGGNGKRSAKHLFQQAWKATKRLGKHKDHHERIA